MGDMKGFSKGAFVILGAFVACIFIYSVFAATSYDRTVGTSMSIAGFVETSVNTTTFSFGELNPGTENNEHTAGSAAAVRLTNTGNSNVAVDVYLIASNMTAGGNWISFENLSVWTSDTPASSVELMNLTYNSSYRNSSSADGGFYEDLAISGTLDLWFWQDVPAGQSPGSYSAQVTLHSVQDGVAP